MQDPGWDQCLGLASLCAALIFMLWAGAAQWRLSVAQEGAEPC